MIADLIDRRALLDALPAFDDLFSLGIHMIILAQPAIET